MSAQIIFYSDSAKSGTTFLQRILNFHSDIGCPSEHSLQILFNLFMNTHKKYNEALSLIGSRIGDEAAPVDQEIFQSSFFNLVEKIIKRTAKSKYYAGIN